MNKKVMYLIICIIIVLLIGGIIFIKKIKKRPAENNIIQPEEEISLDQERKTMISLYFKNKQNNELEPEVRLIDVKELVDDPYNTIINLLIEGPKKENLERLIPEGTKIIETKLEGETLAIDFSEDFIEKHQEGKENEKQTIDSIVKTMTELTEVDSIKILINGEEDNEFKDGEIKFNKSFLREE